MASSREKGSRSYGSAIQQALFTAQLHGQPMFVFGRGNSWWAERDRPTATAYTEVRPDGTREEKQPLTD
jgi:hypothetical protein